MIFLAVMYFSLSSALLYQLLPMITINQLIKIYIFAERIIKCDHSFLMPDLAQVFSYKLNACYSVREANPKVLLILCQISPNVVVSPPNKSGRRPKTHCLGVIIKDPFIIFIILVATPKGRAERMSILSLFYLARILEQISTLLFPELQIPQRWERYTPVHEAMLMIADRCYLFLSLGTRMRLMVKMAQRSTLRSLTNPSGSMVTQGPRERVPALLMTIPMSISANLANCSSNSCSSLTLDRSTTKEIILMFLYIFDSSATLRSTVGLSIPIRRRLNPYSANIYAQPRPIPSVKPVMQTKQSPYFSFIFLPLRFAEFQIWLGSQSHNLTIFLMVATVLAVRAVTPIKKRSFSRTLSSLLKIKDLKYSAKSLRMLTLRREEKIGTIGLLSRMTLFNMIYDRLKYKTVK